MSIKEIKERHEADNSTAFQQYLDCGELIRMVDELEAQIDRTKKCSHCGETDLRWQNFDGMWRLVDCNNEMHECSEYRNSSRSQKVAEENIVKPATEATSKDKFRLTMYIDKAVHLKLKLNAARQDITMTALIQKLVNERLED